MDDAFKSIFKKIGKQTGDISENVFKKFSSSIDDISKYGSKTNGGFNFKKGGKISFIDDMKNWTEGAGRKIYEQSLSTADLSGPSRLKGKVFSSTEKFDDNIEKLILNQGERFKEAEKAMSSNTSDIIKKNRIMEKEKLKLIPNNESKEAGRQYKKLRELRMEELKTKENKISLINEKTSMFSEMSDEEMRKYTSDAVISSKVKESERIAAKVPQSGTLKGSKNFNFDKNSFAYKAVGAGVGGAMIFSMANNRGQQSNEQLYGQK